MSGPVNETPSAPQGQPSPPQGGGSAAQASAAVSNAVSVVRQKLVAGEQLVLVAAAAIVVISYLLFEFLLDYSIFVGGFVPVLSVLTILAIWIHRWGHYDFGNGYRILIGALGISLALFAVTSLLAWVRVGGNSVDFLHLIGRIVFWVSGIVAGYGAWLVFRSREV